MFDILLLFDAFRDDSCNRFLIQSLAVPDEIAQFSDEIEIGRPVGTQSAHNEADPVPETVETPDIPGLEKS